MSGVAVAVEGAAAAYDGAPVLTDVSFSVAPGQSVCVLGPNGGGKTTLFRLLLGQLDPVTGTLELSGRPAYVAQTERTRLDFPVTALDVAVMGTLARGRWWLPPSRSDHGAAQRALLARALVQDAPVLLLDEPLSGVDPASATLITALFRELGAEGRTLLVASHDVESARSFDLVLCLNRRQVAFGPPTATLDRTTLQATYGHELIVLEGGGGAVTVHHHEHGHEH